MIDITQVNPFDLPSVPLKELRGLPGSSGIYFVVAGDEVLYIGQSTSIRQRWQVHHKTRELGSYDKVRIAWLKAENEELAEIERAYIIRFRPCLNGTLFIEREKKLYYLDPGQSDKLDDLRREYKQRTGKKLNEQDFMRLVINQLTLDTLL